MTRRPLSALLVALAVATGGLVACGDDDSNASTTPQPSGTVPVSSTTTTTEAPSSTTTTAAPDLDAVAVELTEVAVLEAPIAMVVRPGHDVAFVAEREGRVRPFADGEVGEPVLDITGDTTTEVERGLLGIAFDPSGEHLYVSYTAEDGANTLEEYSMGAGPTDLDVGSRRLLLSVAHPRSNHNGGHVLFGPDGLLYWGLGDGGAAGDPDDNAEDPNALLGKILRIDPRPSAGAAYGIPGDNPFAGGGGRGEVWVYGVRNPWRFTFDRATGDLWIADVGQNALEEVDLLPAGSAGGADLGWDRREGDADFEGGAPAEVVEPVFTYGRDEGYSITGGFVYRGSRVPDLAGAYLFGDYGTSVVRALAVEDGEVVGDRDLVPVEAGQLVSFAEDADGELWVLSLTGPLYRLDPA